MITALRQQVQNLEKFEIKNISLPRKEYCITALAIVALATIAALWKIKKSFFSAEKIEKEDSFESLPNELFLSQSNVDVSLRNIQRVDQELERLENVERKKREILFASIHAFEHVQLHNHKEGDFLKVLKEFKSELTDCLFNFTKNILSYRALNEVNINQDDERNIELLKDTVQHLHKEIKQLVIEKWISSKKIEQLKQKSKKISPVMLQTHLDNLKITLSCFVYDALRIVQDKFAKKFTGEFDYKNDGPGGDLNKNKQGFIEFSNKYTKSIESYYRGRTIPGEMILILETEKEIKSTFEEFEKEFSELFNYRKNILSKEILYLENMLNPSDEQKAFLKIFERGEEFDIKNALSKKLFLLAFLNKASDLDDFLKAEKNHFLFLRNNPWALLKACVDMPSDLALLFKEEKIVFRKEAIDVIWNHCKRDISREYVNMDKESKQEVQEIVSYLGNKLQNEE